MQSRQAEHLCACCTTKINLNTVETNKQTQKPLEKKELVQKTVPKEEKKVVKKIEPKREETVVVQTQEPKRIEEAKTAEKLQSTPEVVQADKNATQASQSVQEELPDTHCATEVVVEKKVTNKEDDYISLHLEEIVSLLKENLYYPRRARKQGLEGIVKIKFTLSTNGDISNIEVLNSDYEILSRAARETIENLDKKLPKPDEELTLTIPIDYDLK
ncbi:energy transducer TonB [Sulfurimonas microaerophilic]|uniref:energy transducer TonB n=1 Tax=Sulfurimonas microaerophilic TaxID=3058392 RepID=UPI0027154A36|nr:energy transducer TonB [Sulfurimonas sp. hsl 1-7]